MLMHVLHPVQGAYGKPWPEGMKSALDSDAVHHQWVVQSPPCLDNDSYGSADMPAAYSPVALVGQPMAHCPSMVANASPVGVPVLWSVGQSPQGTFMFASPANPAAFGSSLPTKASASPFESVDACRHTQEDSAAAYSPESNRYMSNLREDPHAPTQSRRQRHGKPPAASNDALTSEEIEDLRLAVQNTFRKLQHPDSSDGFEYPRPCFANAKLSKAKECESDAPSSKSFARVQDSQHESWADAVDTDAHLCGVRETSAEHSISDAEVDRMSAELECQNSERRTKAIDWVVSSTRPLAVTRQGCRIVQRALEVAEPEDQKRIADKLEGFVLEALQSPHGNYVLQKCFEVVPPNELQFVFEELQMQGSFVARHRFGCRVIQRILENCSWEQSEELIAEILLDAPQLVRHTYGNFVIQHVLQYGTPDQVHQIADVLLTDAIRFAKHRIASHVMSCALSTCSPEDVQSLTAVLVGEEGQLADLTRRHYGSFVVREVNRVNSRVRDAAKN
jgi:hypothetical protein